MRYEEVSQGQSGHLALAFPAGMHFNYTLIITTARLVQFVLLIVH